MNGRGIPAGGVPIGQAQMSIKQIEVGIPADVTVQPGGIMPGVFTHHLRIVLMAQERMLVVPCDKVFLRTLARQCNDAAGIAQPHNQGNEGN